MVPAENLSVSVYNFLLYPYIICYIFLEISILELNILILVAASRCHTEVIMASSAVPFLRIHTKKTLLWFSLFICLMWDQKYRWSYIIPPAVMDGLIFLQPPPLLALLLCWYLLYSIQNSVCQQSILQRLQERTTPCSMNLVWLYQKWSANLFSLKFFFAARKIIPFYCFTNILQNILLCWKLR